MAVAAFLLGGLAVSVIAFGAIRAPRWLTLLVGAALAAVVFIARGPDADGWLVLGLTALLLVIQIIAPLLVDFWNTLFRIPRDRLGGILGRTLLLGAPALALGGGSVFLSMKVDDWIAARTIYRIEMSDALACEDAGEWRLVCHETGALEGDMKAAIDRAFAALRTDLKAEVRRAVENGDAGSEAGLAAIEASLFGREGALKPHLSDFSASFRYRRNCGPFAWLFDAAACARRMVLQPLDAVYGARRADLRERFRTEAAAALAAGDRGGARLIAATDAFIDARLDRAQRGAVTANARVFLFLALANALTIAVTVLACLKILLLIYARFAFDPDHGGLPISYAGRREGHRAAIRVRDITRKSADEGTPEYGFSQAVAGRRWYANYGGGLSANRKGRLSMPRLLTFPLPRIASGKLFFSAYDADFRGGRFGGHGTHDPRFHRISLPPGRRVAVRIANLVAFSDEVRMRSVFDVKLPLLLQHSFFLRVVEGPGHVIVASRGGNATLMSPDGASAEPFDVIAFDLDGGFHLDVNQGFWSTYFDNHALLPAAGAMAIRTTSPTLKRSASHLIRKTLFFVLPT